MKKYILTNTYKSSDKKMELEFPDNSNRKISKNTFIQIIIYLILRKDNHISQDKMCKDWNDSLGSKLNIGTRQAKDIESQEQLSSFYGLYLVDIIYLSQISNKENELNYLKSLINTSKDKIPEFEIIKYFLNNPNDTFYIIDELKNIEEQIKYFLKENNEFNKNIMNKILELDKDKLLEILKSEDISNVIAEYNQRFENTKRGLEEILKEFELDLFDKIDFNNNLIGFEDITLKNDNNVYKINTNDNNNILNLIDSKKVFLIRGQKGNAKTTTLLMLSLIVDDSRKYYPMYLNSIDILKKSHNDLIDVLNDKYQEEKKIILLLIDNFNCFSYQENIYINKLIDLITDFNGQYKLIVSSNEFNYNKQNEHLIILDIESPKSEKKWIKTYQQLYYYNQLKIDSENIYDFLRYYLIEKSLKDAKKNVKHDITNKNLEILISKIAFNVFIGSAKTINTLIGQGILTGNEEYILSSLSNILIIDPKRNNSIVFKSELFLDFFTTNYLQICSIEEFKKVLDDNDLNEYHWRRVLIFLYYIIEENQEKRFTCESKIIFSLLKHLNSEKMSLESKNILDIIDKNFKKCLYQKMT
jgi:hypothetical protein